MGKTWIKLEVSVFCYHFHRSLGAFDIFGLRWSGVLPTPTPSGLQPGTNLGLTSTHPQAHGGAAVDHYQVISLPHRWLCKHCGRRVRAEGAGEGGEELRGALGPLSAHPPLLVSHPGYNLCACSGVASFASLVLKCRLSLEDTY